MCSSYTTHRVGLSEILPTLADTIAMIAVSLRPSMASSCAAFFWEEGSEVLYEHQGGARRLGLSVAMVASWEILLGARSGTSMPSTSRPKRKWAFLDLERSL